MPGFQAAYGAQKRESGLSAVHLLGNQFPSQNVSLKTSSFLTLAIQHRFQRFINRIDRLKEHLTWKQSMHRPVIMARSYAG
jgi:hypothetical protein